MYFKYDAEKKRSLSVFVLLIVLKQLYNIIPRIVLFYYLSQLLFVNLNQNNSFIYKKTNKCNLQIIYNGISQISKMEHQQAQHQQYLTLEGLDNSSARALVVKCINVLLTVLQVILLLVATAAGIVMPFLRTRFDFSFLALH